MASTATSACMDVLRSIYAAGTRELNLTIRSLTNKVGLTLLRYNTDDRRHGTDTPDARSFGLRYMLVAGRGVSHTLLALFPRTETLP